MSTLWLFVVAGVLSAAPQQRPAVAVEAHARRGNQSVAKAVAALPRKAASREARFALWPDGSLRAVSGIESKAYGGTPENAARRFVEENAAVFGPGPAPDLEPFKTTEMMGMKTVRMRQTLDGYPVLGQEVVLNLSATHAVEAIQGRYLSNAARKGAWSIDRDKAIAAARGAKAGNPLGEVKAERAWRADGATVIPVWQVRFTTADGDWQMLVSAESGKVLETKNLRVGQTIQRQGFAFPSNPAVGDLARVNLTNLSSTNRLTGTNVRVLSYYRSVASEGARSEVEQLAAPDGNGLYGFQPPDPRFSEVQAYFTINRAADYFKAVGFPGIPQLPAIVWFADCEPGRGCQGQFNAFFSHSFLNDAPTVVMYVTPKGGDTSWDSDAIIHEYGHAVVNALVGPDQGETFGALNEGVADYFSCSLLNDPNVGEYFALLVGDRLRFLRTVSNENRFPGNIVGEVHVDGNVWSGALWDVRRLLGQDKTDRIALLTMANLSSQAEFYDAAVTALEAARRLYGPVDATAVEQVMRERGILSDAAELAANASALSPDGEPGRGQIGGSRPGVTLLARTQFKFAVPPQATAFTVEVAAEQPVRLLASYRSPVVVNDDGTTTAEYFSEAGTRLQFRVDVNSDPEIQTGTYYVVLGNTAASATAYALRVTFEGDPEGPSLRLTNLTINGGELKGSIPTGPLLNSRLFVLRVPQTATGLAVAIQGDTDVDLFIRAGNPVTINNQGLPEADLAVETADSAEVALLTRSTIPALRPGVYTVGVLNYDDTRPAHFVIAAQTTDAPLPRTQVSPLLPSVTVALPKAYGAAWLSERQFTVSIPDAAQRLRLAIDTRLDATVYLRRGREVSVNADGRVQADFVIRAREKQTVDLLRSSAQALETGVYYVAVSNSSTQEGNVTINHQVQ